MKKRLFSALAAFLASSGLAFGQGYYPRYPVPPMPAYGNPHYGNPYHRPPAYPVVPGPPYVVGPGGTIVPMYPTSVGRATVGAMAPATAAPPMAQPSVPLLVTEVPGTKAPAVVDAQPALRSATLPDASTAKGVVVASPGVQALPVLHWKKRATVAPSGPACSTCLPGPASSPLRDLACGIPMTCEVDCHGQPIIERELNLQPRGYCAYARMDVLFWSLDEQTSPTLFQLASPRGPILFNAGSADNGERMGAKTTLGYWLNPCHTVGLEASFLWIANRTGNMVTGGASLSRPFFDTSIGAENSFPVFGPGTTGTASISTKSQFYTGEINFRKELWRFGCGHLDLLVGGRYLNFEEGLRVDTNQAFAAGGTLTTTDIFSTRNDFYGGQVGLDAEINRGRFYVNPWGKIAVGYIDQYSSIAGARNGADATGAAISAAGGFLALPSNVGTYRDGEMCYIPEFGVNVGFKVTESCRVLAGYSALIIASAARPGDQVNRNLNLTQLDTPGGAAAVPVGPLSPFTSGVQDSVFWAQGVNFGLEFRW